MVARDHRFECVEERWNHGQSRPGSEVEDSTVFCTWCLVKPVAMAALIALADKHADGLDTPVRAVSGLARDADLDSAISIFDLQSLRLKLDKPALVEAICVERRDLYPRIVAELEDISVPLVPGAAFHSEFTTWCIVSEAIEALSGQQPGSYLNVSLAELRMAVYFGVEPHSTGSRGSQTATRGPKTERLS